MERGHVQHPNIITAYHVGEIGPPMADRRDVRGARTSGLCTDFCLCFNR